MFFLTFSDFQPSILFVSKTVTYPSGLKLLGQFDSTRMRPTHQLITVRKQFYSLYYKTYKAVIKSTIVKCLRARLGAYSQGGVHSGRLQSYRQMLDQGRSVKKFYSTVLQNVVQSCLASPLSTIVGHFDSSLHFHSTPLPVRERADTFLFFKF